MRVFNVFRFLSRSVFSVVWSCDYLLESEQASPGDHWRCEARDPQQGVEERKSTKDIKEKSQRPTLTWLLQDGLTNPNFWVIWLVLNSCHLPSTRVWALISYFTKRSALRLMGPCSQSEDGNPRSVCLTLCKEGDPS